MSGLGDRATTIGVPNSPNEGVARVSVTVGPSGNVCGVLGHERRHNFDIFKIAILDEGVARRRGCDAFLVAVRDRDQQVKNCQREARSNAFPHTLLTQISIFWDCIATGSSIGSWNFLWPAGSLQSPARYHARRAHRSATRLTRHLSGCPSLSAAYPTGAIPGSGPGQ